MDILIFSQSPAGNFLVTIITWLIKISSSIALGVVLFTLLLKLVTLPFDYISRSSMRKNSLKMEQMRPELEKLQEQYANDKGLYQQKMMALYKKNGYSMFGACLPTILTLVIFIVAINAFTNYSKLQNKEYFYNMTTAYNNVLYSGMDVDGEYISRKEDGTLVINGEKLYSEYLNGKSQLEIKNENGEKLFNIDFSVSEVGSTAIEENNANIGTRYDKKLFVSTENSFVKVTLNFNVNDFNDPEKQDELNFTTTYFEAIAEKLDNADGNNKLASAENNYLKIQLLDEEGNFKLDENGNKIEKSFSQAIAEGLISGDDDNQKAKAFILDIRQQKSADKYREEQANFLWVKNIWVTDSPLSHPVEDSWSDFRDTHGYDGNDIGDEGYASLTNKLTYEKNAPNGYFILVILTAGSSLLMQLVMSKSQKAQMELQTVDGRGAQTQKMMTIMMPIMMAFFAFMYTSAFSIYIILSSVISMATTFAINKIVDTKFKKQNAQSEEKSRRIRGRIYTPKQEEIKEEPKKDKTKKQVNAHGDDDFLSGKADGKKHVRGRLK